VNIEFSNNTQDDKFFSDHRKIIREAKNIGDVYYRSPFLKKTIKRSVQPLCIQIAVSEGQILAVKLVQNGLYVATKIGSLRLPTSGIDLRKIRTLLERLSYVKVCVILIDKSDLVLTSFV
jgi:hypothetical protein